jgi:O-antigen/teichoic acid export membrane protein
MTEADADGGKDATGDLDLGVEVTKGMAAKPIQAALGFTGVVVFARELGPAGIGGFYLLLSLAQVVDFPVDGLSSALKKRYSEADAARGELFGLFIAIVAAAAALVAAGSAIAGERLTAYAGVGGAATLFVALFIGTIVFAPLQSLLVATGRLGLQTWTDTIRSALTLGLQLLFVIVIPLGVAGMAIGWVLGAAIGIVVVLYVLRPSVALPTRATAQDVCSFAQYSAISSGIARTYDRYDVLLLGLLVGPAAAGDYEVALRLTVPGAFVSALLGSGLMAKASNRHSRGTDVAEPITDSVAFASVLSIPIAFGAAALARPLLVTAYGAAYADAVGLLIGLAVWQVFSTQVSVLEQALLGVDQPRDQTYVSAVALVVNIVLGVAFVVRFGPVGVVAATLIAETIRYLALLTLVRRAVPEADLLPGTLLTQLVAGAATYLVARLVRGVVSIDSWAVLLIIVGVGAAAYGAVLVVASSRVRTTVIGIGRRLIASYA